MATYFWVGGTGTWDGSSTSNWSATSGGAGGSGPPNASDTVNFDSNSGVGVCTTVVGAVADRLTMNVASLELSLGANLALTTLLTLTLGTVKINGYIFSFRFFSSTNTNTRVIDFGGGSISLSGSGASIWSLNNGTNFSYVGTPVVNLTYSGGTGTRAVSSFTSSEATALTFNVVAGTDTVRIDGRARTVDLTGFSGTYNGASDLSLYENFTVSSGTTVASGAGTLTFSGSPKTRLVTSNGKTFDFNLSVNTTGSTIKFLDALTQGSTKAFTFTAGTVQFKDGVTSTVGVFTTPGTTQKSMESTFAGSQATLSKASGIVNVTYLTIKDINATGGATWNSFTTNNNIDGGNNSGWDFNILQLGRYIFTRRKNKRILP
jgi:hypothetical protein